MKRPPRLQPLIYLSLLGLFLTWLPFPARGADVTARVQMDQAGAHQKMKMANSSYVVLWLSPLSENNPKLQTEQSQSGDERRAELERRYRLVQHNKEFSPHLLVVPVGSSVDFPNRDPFYHNVFCCSTVSGSILGCMNQGVTGPFTSIMKGSLISSAIFIRRWARWSLRCVRLILESLLRTAT